LDNLITKIKKVPEPDLSLLLHSSKGAKSRKRILNKLLCGSKSYRHLKILEKESLVKSFDFGTRKFYKLTLKGEKVTKISLNAR
jgi:hypothetical protein